MAYIVKTASEPAAVTPLVISIIKRMKVPPRPNSGFALQL